MTTPYLKTSYAAAFLKGVENAQLAGKTPLMRDQIKSLHFACLVGRHFVLNMPPEEVAAFAKMGGEQIEEFASLPFDNITVSYDGRLAIASTHTGLIHSRTKEQFSGPSVVVSTAFRAEPGGPWHILNYVAALGPDGLSYGFHDRALLKDWSEESRTRARRAARVSLAVVAAVCGALSCTNVEAEVCDRAPSEVVNARRVRDGKSRIFDTHTLVVHVAGGGKYSPGGFGSGGHASPRQHLRRGHIRRLPTGKNVWVQSCVVGDPSNGFLDTTYVIAK